MTISIWLFSLIVLGVFIAGWFACNTWQAKAAAFQKKQMQALKDELNYLRNQAANKLKS